MSGVRVLHVEKLQHELSARGHSLLLDEPEEVGGDDRGPNPYELLLGALGACTAMTLRLYAERKGWPLDDVVVELDHNQSHREDCQDCDKEDRRLTTIQRTIRLTGELDDEQRGRLLEIARRCPVHRTLEGKVEVEDVAGE